MRCYNQVSFSFPLEIERKLVSPMTYLPVLRVKQKRENRRPSCRRLFRSGGGQTEMDRDNL